MSRHERNDGLFQENSIIGECSATNNTNQGFISSLLPCIAQHFFLWPASICLLNHVDCFCKCFCLCLLLYKSFSWAASECPSLFCISQTAIAVCVAETLLAVLSTGDSEEALLYCVGALKFLSGNDAIVRLLLDNHCMSAVQRLIEKLCGAEADRSAMAGHILVQVRPWGGSDEKN